MSEGILGKRERGRECVLNEIHVPLLCMYMTVSSCMCTCIRLTSFILIIVLIVDE